MAVIPNPVLGDPQTGWQGARMEQKRGMAVSLRTGLGNTGLQHCYLGLLGGDGVSMGSGSWGALAPAPFAWKTESAPCSCSKCHNRQSLKYPHPFSNICQGPHQPAKCAGQLQPPCTSTCPSLSSSLPFWYCSSTLLHGLSGSLWVSMSFGSELVRVTVSWPGHTVSFKIVLICGLAGDGFGLPRV